MKRKCFLLLIYFALIGQTFAQITTSESVGSLLKQLQTAKHDTSKVMAMVKLAVLYRDSNAETSNYYAESAIQLAINSKFAYGEAAALNVSGRFYSMGGNFPKALQRLLRGLEISKNNDFKDLQLTSNRLLGTVSGSLEDFENYSKYQKEALRLATEIGDYKQQASCMIGYAISFVTIEERFGHKQELSDSTKKYLTLARQNLDPEKDPQDWAYLLRTTGNYYEQKGQIDSAFYYYKIALSMTDRTGANVVPLKRIANLFQIGNQPDSAIFYGLKLLRLAQDLKLNRRIYDAASILAKAFKAKGDYQKAFQYQEIAAEKKEDIWGQTNMQAIRTMIEEKQQQEFENEQAKIKLKSKLQTNIFLGITTTLLIIAFFLFRNNRIKQRAKKKIEIAYDQLKATQSQLIQSEKMASLGELTAGIAHEIQNPLNFVNNFSEVNTELINELNEEAGKGNLEEVKVIAKGIKENEEKITHHGKRADAIVKGMLQHSRSSSGVKEPTDINALCDEYLRLAYHGLKAKNRSFNATMKTDFDESIGNINIIPQDIGRVVLNLINNAFYAVDEKKKQNITGYDPTVTVSTKKTADKISISVKDNGNGIPDSIKEKIFQPFFTTKPTGQGTGLGLSLSYDIVKAHGGELKVESKEKEGTLFTIQLPIN